MTSEPCFVGQICSSWEDSTAPLLFISFRLSKVNGLDKVKGGGWKERGKYEQGQKQERTITTKQING